MAFQPTAFLACRPLPESIEHARATWEEHQQQASRMMFETTDPWLGFLGEQGFRRCLRDHRVEHTHNGGVDHEPDFVVGGVGVALKTRRLTQQEQVGLGVQCFVPADHVGHQAVEWFFFACWHDHSQLLYLLGAITRKDLDEHAKIHDVGSAAWVRYPCRSITAAQLVPPAVWFSMMKP
jgi:hypothetical protein